MATLREQYELRKKMDQGSGAASAGAASLQERYNAWRRENKGAELAANMQSRVQSWMDEHNSFLQSYADRFGGRDGDYSTLGYVTDAQDWYDSAAEKGSALGDTASKLLEDLQRDSYIYGDEYVQAVSELLTTGRDVYAGITETAKRDADYWTQWENEDAYIKSAPEASAQRQQRYADNQKRIEELQAEWDAYEYDWTDAAQRKAADEEYERVQSEIEDLKADNLQYERGEGGYITKATDDHRKTTQNGDFALRSANREYKNPTREEIDLADVMNDSTTWKWDDVNGVYRDSFGNELAVDENNTYYNPVARETKVVDKLGLYLDTSEDERIAAARNTGEMREGIWTSVMRDGYSGAWEYLTDDEKGIYYYYLDESQEKAYQYLDDMVVELNRRRTLDEQGKWQQTYDDTGFLGKVGMNALTIPSQLVSGVVGNVDNAVNILSGNEINPYSSAHRGSHYSQTVRGATAEDLNATGVKIPVVDFTLGDLYQSGMSMLDSLAAMGVSGTYGGVLLAGGAAENEAYRLYQQGASTGQIAFGAAAAGATELIFESLSIGELDKIKNMKSPKTLGQFFKTLLVQGGVEASEEAVTEIANTVANAFIMGSQSDWTVLMKENDGNLAGALMDKTLDVLHSGLGGFFSGAGSGSIVGGSQYAYNKLADRAEKNTAQGSSVKYKLQTYSEQQKKNWESSKRIVLYEGVEQFRGFIRNALTGKTKTNKKMYFGSVDPEFASAISKETGVEVEGYNLSLGENEIRKIKKDHGDEAKESLRGQRAVTEADYLKIPEVVQSPDSIKLSPKEYNGKPVIEFRKTVGNETTVVAAVVSDKRLDLFVQTTYINKKSGSIATPKSEQADFNTPEASSGTAPYTSISDSVAGVNGENVSALTALAAEKVDLENGADEETSAEGRAILDEETVDVAEIADAGNGKVAVKLTDGRTVDAAQLSFPEDGEQELWRVIGKYAEDADSARALLEEYRNGSLDAFTYARGVEEAYLYGKVNLSEKEMDLKSNIANQLSPSQRKEAYTQGRIAGEKKAKKQKSDAAEHDPKRRRKGAVHYGYEGETLDKSKLKPTQKVGVDFAERLARKKGMTFYFYRSFMQDGVRVYKNAEGKIVPTKKNGWYDPKDGSIHIDLNSGDMGSTVLFTIAHELTHWMKDTNLTRYRELCAIVTEGFLERGQSIERLVQNKMEEYRLAGEQLTWEEAYDEVIASSLEGVLSDGNVMDLLDTAETKSLPLWEQLKSFLEEIAILIHETIQAYRDVEPESPEGRMILRMKELHKQIQETFAAGIHEGGEDFREGGKINTAQDGGVKAMIMRNVIDSNGAEYDRVVKPGLSVYQTVKHRRKKFIQFLRDKIFKRSFVVENGNGESVKIEFAKENEKVKKDGSNSWRPVLGEFTSTDDRLKMIAIINVKDLVKNSVPNDHNRENKHQWLDYNGWYDRTAYMFDHDEVYPVILHIAHTKDGRFLMYDISVIKEKGTAIDTDATALTTSNVRASADNNQQSAVKVAVPTRTDISQDGNNVNKNSLRYQKNEAAQSHMAAQDAKLAADMAGLKAFVNLQKKQGRQGKMETAATNAAATFLMKTASAKGDKAELMNLLDGFYRYVANSTEQSWESIREKAMPIVRWLMQNTVRTKQRSDYAQDVLNTLHGSRVSLDETQKGEVAHIYGSFSAFRNTVMGSVTLANDGISLDSQWQEWAEMYPDLFDADMNAVDMPEALSDIVHRLRNDNTSELEYEFSREFIEQELLSRVYDSYWNASTLYSVADHYEGQIKQLKAKHRELMQTVYARHQEAEAQQRDVYRQRQEAAKSHYEERHQRREAEYRESRRQAVERHDKAQVRQQIRKDVKRLDSLLNRGTKEKNVKLELQDFAGAALRTAKGAFLKNYNEYDMVRSGVNATMTREQKAVFARCQELLKELDGILRGKQITLEGFDPEADLRLDDREEALKKELSKNMAVLRQAGIFKLENELLEDSIADQLMDELMAAYNALKESENAHIRGVFSTAIYNQMASVKKFLAGKAIKDMTAIELGELKKMYRMVLHTITTSNDLFAQQRKTDVRKLGEEVIEQLRTPGKEMTPEILDTLAKMGWANLKPETALELIGSDTLTEMMQGLYRGEDTYARDLEHAKQYAEEQGKKYGRSKWDLKKSMEFAGTKITLGQAMSLYAYTKRKQAQGHLEGEGFTHSSNVRIKETKGKAPVALSYIMNATRTHIVPKGMYEQVADLLTPQQRKYVDAMQDYLSKVMGAKGNEVSMQLYGVKLFEETMYFPLKTASEYREEALGATAGEVKLKNSGFTNTVVEKASNPIVLDSFEDVWAGHVDKMSLYHGFVLPMEDFDRVYNYRHQVEKKVGGETVKDTYIGEGIEMVDTNESVKVNIENKMGKAANAYIEDLMKQLNGGVRGDSTEKLFGTMVRNFKKTAVLGSLSVAVQQPTAFIRAMAYLDIRDVGNPKDFLGKAGKPEGKILDEMYKYAPVALMKRIGGFDPGLGRTTRDYVFEDKQGIPETLDKFLGKFPEKMDEWTWSYIWVCTKRQIHRQNPDLKINSEEFLQKVGERFSKIIRDTQVYDSVLTKSQIMRSKNVWLQMATAFMNEPTTSMDMYIRSTIQAKRGKIKKSQAARTYAAVVGSQILTSAVVAFVYALRDDDEDETYWEKYLSAMVGKAWENTMPWYSIPFVKDIFSVFDGYSVERSDMSLIVDLYQGWQKLMSNKATPWEKTEAFAGSILNLFGIPLKNVSRDIRGIYNTMNTWITGGVEKTDAGLRYAALEGLTGKKASKAEQLQNAVAENDAKHILRVMASYSSESSACTAFRSAVEAAYLQGDVTADQAVEFLQAYAGDDTVDAQGKVSTWDFQKQHPETALKDGKILDYTEYAEPAGISLEIYTEYCEKKSGYTKRDDILKVINKLPISKAQKDALYYAEGYAESTLDDAPWH